MVKLLYQLTLRNLLSNNAGIQHFLLFGGFRENEESVILAHSEPSCYFLNVLGIPLSTQGRDIRYVLTLMNG